MIFFSDIENLALRVFEKAFCMIVIMLLKKFPQPHKTIQFDSIKFL